MTLPKRCLVIACERRPMCSRNSEAAGEISMAKSASDNFDLAMLSRTEPAPASSDRFTSDWSGNELNSETKLTQTSYQSGRQSRDGEITGEELTCKTFGVPPSGGPRERGTPNRNAPPTNFVVELHRRFRRWSWRMKLGL